MSAIAAFEALLLAAGAALAVFAYSRPSSTSRAVLFTLFIGVAALAAMVLSVHTLLTAVVGTY
jgi:hypothetical protein